MNLDKVEKQYARDLENVNRHGLEWKLLLDQIHKLKITLLKLDTDDTGAVEYFAEHAKRIKDSVPSIPVNQYVAPIHQLFRVGPLKRIEIPCDILAILTSAGFDVNYEKEGETCLHVAITYRHYESVKWLVEQGADCNASKKDLDQSPISMLARKPNVQLELFDLLKTSENLNGGTYLPLHEALQYRHTDYAWHLIQIGAKFDAKDVFGKKPIDHYVGAYLDEFHEELFLKLMLPEGKILLCKIRNILKIREYKFEVMSQMIAYLLQYLVSTNLDAINVGVAPIDHDEVSRTLGMLFMKPEYVYMDSLLVLLLGMDKVKKPFDEQVHYMPDECCKQAIDDIWNAYNHRNGNVKPLVTLCIRSVRNSMSSLDTNSFHSLPVTSPTRDLLMLRNVAGILCEARRFWPQCLPMKDIVKEAL